MSYRFSCCFSSQLTHLQEFGSELAGAHLKETQLKKRPFLKEESASFVPLLLRHILSCAGCNSLGLFNPVACGSVERKAMPEWFEHLRVVKSWNRDCCDQGKGLKQLSHKSCFKTRCTNSSLVCALLLTT